MIIIIICCSSKVSEVIYIPSLARPPNEEQISVQLKVPPDRGESAQKSSDYPA